MQDTQQAQVALVCMPFATVKHPAMSVSLLKAEVSQLGIECDVHYLNLRLAKRIGEPLYHHISHASSELLLGDWFFAQELFGRQWAQEHPLLERELLQSEKTAIPGKMVFPAELIESLWEARALAGAFLDECLLTKPWASYKIVGFSLSCCQTVASLALAKRIKEAYPGVVIVFGGGSCQGEIGSELHRKFSFIDFLCLGEGDRLFPELVEGLLAGGKLPPMPGMVKRGEDGASLDDSPSGDSFRKVGSSLPILTDMDSLPYPDFSDYFQQLQDNSLELVSSPMLVFESSRGCWWGEKQTCTFCGIAGNRIAFRSKTPGRVMDELAYLTRRYGIKRLATTDLILDIRYLRELLPELADRGSDWILYYLIKPNLQKDQLRLMKQAGFTSFGSGIESLSTSVLKLMRKGCTALGNVQTLKWASEVRLEVYWNMMLGIPGEDPEEYNRMAEMIPSLLHLYPPAGCIFMHLVRSSPLFKNSQDGGLMNLRVAPAYYLVYDLPEGSLWRLANSFEFDHASGRDPKSYTIPCLEKISYWQDKYCPGALTSLSDGGAIVIHDRRPSSRRSKFELTGMEAATYEYCDEAHSLGAIHRHLHTLGCSLEQYDLRKKLNGWVNDRLMLRDGDVYLSLAVPADDLAGYLSDEDVIQQALAGAIAGLVHRMKAPKSSL